VLPGRHIPLICQARVRADAQDLQQEARAARASQVQRGGAALDAHLKVGVGLGADAERLKPLGRARALAAGRRVGQGRRCHRVGRVVGATGSWRALFQASQDQLGGLGVSGAGEQHRCAHALLPAAGEALGQQGALVLRECARGLDELALEEAFEGERPAGAPVRGQARLLVRLAGGGGEGRAQEQQPGEGERSEGAQHARMVAGRAPRGHARPAAG